MLVASCHESFNIIYEDDDFIVINKPHGLLTIESDNEKTEKEISDK